MDKILDKLVGPVTEEDVVDYEAQYGTGKDEQPKTRKTRGPGKKNTALVAEGTNEQAAEPPNGKQITYTISVYSQAQMKLDTGKRGKPKNTFLQLGSKAPWDTFIAQLLVKIDGILNPSSIAFGDYGYSFLVPRIHPKATDLTDEASYLFMVDRALQAKGDSAASITVEPILKAATKRKSRSNKENNSDSGDSDDGSGSDGHGRARKKSKKKSDVKELPGNIAIARELGALREKWGCHTPSCENKGSHCYVSPVDGSHFALGHDHFNIWAAAILQGPDRATQSMPPLHAKFDTVNTAQATTGGEKTAQISTLQRRAAAHKAALAQSSVAAGSPVIHVHVPDMSNVFQPHPYLQHTSTPATPISAVKGINTIRTVADNPPLVPANAPIRQSLPLSEFADLYSFSENIRNTLQGEGFTSSNQLRMILLQELRDMGLKRGEIAVLQEAAGIHWAIE